MPAKYCLFDCSRFLRQTLRAHLEAHMRLKKQMEARRRGLRNFVIYPGNVP